MEIFTDGITTSLNNRTEKKTYREREREREIGGGGAEVYNGNGSINGKL